MKQSIPENGIYGMTDSELDAAVADAELRELNLRNFLSELRLHQMMRRHVKKKHLKDNIEALQRQMEAL